MSTPIPVTTDNFIRAETDLYFGNIVKDGGFGHFFHNREPTPIDHQVVIRQNRDTLYSGAVFDLEAAPATITLPDPGNRFMSMQVFDEDEYSPLIAYRAGTYTLTREKIGTRYAMVAMRILVNPGDRHDVQQVHTLQDSIKVEQRSSGSFETPDWDSVSQKEVRDALLVLGSRLPDTKRMFGTKDQVDPVRRLIGAAAAWGGNPETEATYLNFTPAKNDGKNHVPPHAEGRSRRWLLVDQRIQRPGVLREESTERLFDQQPDGQEEPGWVNRCAIRRLRREGPELHPDQRGLELSRAALSSAT